MFFQERSFSVQTACDTASATQREFGKVCIISENGTAGDPLPADGRTAVRLCLLWS